MTRHGSVFKDTQFFDWESEPSLERESTSFYADEFTPAEKRRARQSSGGMGILLLVCSLLIGTGLVALLELTPVLRHLLS